MHRWIAAIVVAAAAAISGSAQTLYIPAAANAEGVNQTRWRTDLEVKAEGEQAATFRIELLESGVDNSAAMSLDGIAGAGSCVRFSNLLETGFGFTGTGALRLTATSGRILATSRTFNDDPHGTYGQTVPAVAEGGSTPFGSRVTLIQLSRSGDPATGFRTNIGLVNVVGRSITVTVDLFLADGSPLGSITRTLKPFEHRQINDAFHAAGADDVGDGFAVVRTLTDGGRFIAYASVVDNRSGDAVFLLGQAEVTPAPADPRLVVLESFLRPG
jgi:hypothetical protein